MDLSDTIIPKSDQLNAEDFISGPQTFTIREVKRGAAEQPVDIMLVETERAYRPSKSMRRVLVSAWGKEGERYSGHKLTLYRDPEVRFGGDKVGGIKISHLSHIDGPMSIMLTATRGSRKPHPVAVLTDAAPAHKADAIPLPERIEMALTSFSGIGISADRLEAKLGTPRGQWGAQQVADMGIWYTSITRDGIDASSLLPEVLVTADELENSRQSVPRSAVEEGTPAPMAMGGVPEPVGEVGSEQRLPISSAGASVLSGARRQVREQNVATIIEEFDRIFGGPVSPDERSWWLGTILAHPVESITDLDADDLRKVQARLSRTRDRDQLETEFGLKGGE